MNVLSDKDLQKVLLAFAVGRGDKGFTEEEAQEVCNWAQDVVVQNDVLKLVLKGLVTLDLVKSVNVKTRDISFNLTDRGREISNCFRSEDLNDW